MICYDCYDMLWCLVNFGHEFCIFLWCMLPALTMFRWCARPPVQAIHDIISFNSAISGHWRAAFLLEEMAGDDAIRMPALSCHLTLDYAHFGVLAAKPEPSGLVSKIGEVCAEFVPDGTSHIGFPYFPYCSPTFVVWDGLDLWKDYEFALMPSATTVPWLPWAPASRGQWQVKCNGQCNGVSLRMSSAAGHSWAKWAEFIRVPWFQCCEIRLLQNPRGNPMENFVG